MTLKSYLQHQKWIKGDYCCVFWPGGNEQSGYIENCFYCVSVSVMYKTESDLIIIMECIGLYISHGGWVVFQDTGANSSSNLSSTDPGSILAQGILNGQCHYLWPIQLRQNMSRLREKILPNKKTAMKPLNAIYF